MKTSTYFLLVATALATGMGVSPALAQDEPDAPGASLNAPSVPVTGTVKRYLVTYFYSNTNAAFPPRNASIVSVTNQNTASCRVAVHWKVGLGGIVCTTSIVVAPGNQVDFCTRTLPFNVVACNSTCSPALTFTEGNATVASSTTTGCERIAVSARTVYTAAGADTSVSAITDAKVVRFGAGNFGD